MAPRREHLHAEADSEERDPPDHRLLAQDLVQPALPDVTDAVAERTDAGQHDVRRALDVLGTIGHDRTAAALLDGARHRVEVAHPVIDHGHTLHELS